MNRKTSAMVALLLAWSVLAVQPAQAQVFDIATGIAGDLVDGVLFGGTLAADLVTSGPATHRSQPPPSAGYYAEEQPPLCRSRRVRAWDGYGWYYRRSTICG
jgi:hypothetical protein